jgi:predicted ArsR family transcriptional regulator
MFLWNIRTNGAVGGIPYVPELDSGGHVAGWFDRWVNSTRGRILSLLRSDDATVSDLAENVGVSDNAVRTHLASLQRDGLVEEAGTTHEGGVGKPAQLFRATAHGEELFPKAYAAVLGHVLRTVAEQEGEEGLVALLENVGRRVGHLDRPNGRPEDRVEATAQLLRALGGDIDIVPQADGSWMLEGNGCPLSAVVRDQAAVCTLIEALAAEATGEAVTQCCQHGDRPRCSFRIEKPGGQN